MSLRTREQKDPELSFSRLLAFSIMLIRSAAAAQRDDFLGGLLYYRLRIEYLEEDLTSEAARNGILSGMLERCYDRSERDLARLRMALERAAQLEGEANRAEPVAAGKEKVSARGQVVGAHDVPQVCRQGQGVAVQGVSSQGAGVCLGGLQPQDGGVLARKLGGQRRGGDGPQESVGHLGVHLQRRDPCLGSAGPPPS